MVVNKGRSSIMKVKVWISIDLSLEAKVLRLSVVVWTEIEGQVV